MEFALNPSMVKDLRKGKYLTIMTSSRFLLQENLNWNAEKVRPAYRIITTGFPRYRISASNDLHSMRATWEFIHSSVSTLPTQKDNRELVNGITDEDDHPETTEDEITDQELHQDSIQMFAGTPKKSPISSNDTEETTVPDAQHTTHIETDYAENDFESSIDDISKIPKNEEHQQDDLEDTSFLARLGIDEFFFRYASLLISPPLPPPGKNASLNFIRESHLVKKRQRYLAILTLFILCIRFCSFDFFLFMTIASNFILLYVLRNSKKINIEIAKRTVRTRVNWAKQYLGGFMHKPPSNTVQSMEDNLKPQLKMRLLSKLRKKTDLPDRMVGESVGDDVGLVERRGLFRRSSKPAHANANTNVNTLTNANANSNNAIIGKSSEKSVSTLLMTQSQPTINTD